MKLEVLDLNQTCKVVVSPSSSQSNNLDHICCVSSRSTTLVRREYPPKTALLQLRDRPALAPRPPLSPPLTSVHWALKCLLVKDALVLLLLIYSLGATVVDRAEVCMCMYLFRIPRDQDDLEKLS